MRLQLILLLVLSSILSSCRTEEERDRIQDTDGLYRLCREYPDMDLTLMLSNGTYKYWFSSHWKEKTPPKYPLEGTFSVVSGRVQLDREVPIDSFELGTINGVRILWVEDQHDESRAFELTGRIHPRNVLVSVSSPEDRPSIGILNVPLRYTYPREAAK